MSRIEVLRERFENLKERRGKAKLVAVTKKTSLDDILLSYQLGQRDFGENRVQDLLDKALETEKRDGLNDIRWHFIGHLQSNKIKKLAQVPHLYSIHSIDSLGLLKKLIHQKDLFSQKEIKVFLQVNTSGEEEKGGFKELGDLFEVFEFFETFQKEQSRIPFKLSGLMTMGRIRTESFESDAEQCFRKLVGYKEEIQVKYPSYHLELSMGMTKDVEIAVKEGSDWVRVGSYLYS